MLVANNNFENNGSFCLNAVNTGNIINARHCSAEQGSLEGTIIIGLQ